LKGWKRRRLSEAFDEFSTHVRVIERESIAVVSPRSMSPTLVAITVTSVVEVNREANLRNALILGD
jgi:hypothetical protein